VLRRAPVIEFEALDAGSWSGREAVPRVPSDWLLRQGEEPGGLVIRHASAAAVKQADALLKLTQRAGLAVRRLSVRGTEPQFQLHVALPDRRQAAHDFFKAVRAIAERALA
jgi:hypothetical protein